MRATRRLSRKYKKTIVQLGEFKSINFILF